jgi:hypothetical protein
MTTQLQDHIHLFAYTNQTQLDQTAHDASLYHLLMPGFDGRLETSVAVERGLTGKPHVYQVVDGNGDPYLFRNGTLTLMERTTEKDTLETLSGKICWLILNYHDDDSGGVTPVGSGSGYKCVAVVTNSRLLNPTADYWYVYVQITDIDQ